MFDRKRLAKSIGLWGERGARVLLLILLLGLIGGAFAAGQECRPGDPNCPQPPPGPPPPTQPAQIPIYITVAVAGAPECDVQKHPITAAKVTVTSTAAEDKDQAPVTGQTDEKGLFAAWVIVTAVNTADAVNKLQVAVEKAGFKFTSGLKIAIGNLVY